MLRCVLIFFRINSISAWVISECSRHLDTDFFGVFQEELPTLCVVENIKEEQSVMLDSHIFFVLANIRPNIRHILGISLLPLFYPYGRYLALFYIYRPGSAVAYTIYYSQPLIRIYCPRNHNWWWSAIPLNPGLRRRPSPIIPRVNSALAHRLRANPRIPEI